MVADADFGARGHPTGGRPVVVHLVHHYVAPTETFIVNQVDSISGFRVVVGCHHRHRASLYPLGDGVAAVDILGPIGRRIDGAAYSTLAIPTVFTSRALGRMLRAENPVLAHVHYLSDACYFHSTLRLLGVPFIISCYGYDVSHFPRRAHGVALRLVQRAFREASAVLAMSSDMRTDLIRLGCPPEKIITHYHGSDATRFALSEPRTPRSGDVQLLSSCGRLNEKKGLAITLDALAILRDRGNTSWRLTVLGDGPARASLATRISQLGLSERVRLAGHLPYSGDDLAKHYRDADVLVQPSILTAAGDKEGIPGVIVEAMASGLAVVASRHAGIPAVIEDGVSGLLVPERDPAALATALERVMGDFALRRRLGAEAARRAAEELDLRVRTPILEAIYARIGGSDRPGSGPHRALKYRPPES